MRILIFILSIITLAGCAKPLARFSYDQDNNAAPAKVQFKNDSEKAETYYWDFGDGMTSEEISPEHNYILSGKYNVTLIAKKGKKENKVDKDIIVEAPKQCLILMETSLGSMTFKLFDETPQHRDNFVKLAESGFYEGLLFHRVMNGFMIQGGDPNSKNAGEGARLGTGGPGYTVPAEFTPKHVHLKGALAAARQPDQVNPDKNSSGSQFYIVQGKPTSRRSLEVLSQRIGIHYTEEQSKYYEEIGGTAFLDMEYTVFGMIVDGLDVIDKIAEVSTDPANRPLEDVKILSVKVIK